MWRNKRFLLVALLVPAVLVGSIGGVALAQSDGQDSTQAQATETSIYDRASQIYQENTGVVIDSEALKDAFAQARSEMQTEALQDRLQSLVDEGTITQEEADQYLEWWQSRPDVPLGLGPGGHGGFCGMGRIDAPTE